jgi:kynureninase
LSHDFSPDESCARRLDADDRLAGYRDQFHIPQRADGSDLVYLLGNSLGLQPKGAGERLDQELEAWATFGVDAYFEGPTPWYAYQETFRQAVARLVGAKPHEVVAMNSLTVNLHLMLVTFYRPTKTRYKILMEYPAFPSDTHAVKTQLARHGYDPDEALLIVKPQANEHTIRTADIEQMIERNGEQIALVMLGGVNFFTGQVFDMRRVAVAAKHHGCVIGYDLGHAVGNVPLQLHDWNADFAVWCSYKYLNGGPGAVAGCFIHETHGHNLDLPRFGGWWGNDPKTRFMMHLQPEFIPQGGADGWQISCPPILAMAPMVTSYELFDKVGMPELRRKSELLTGYLQYLIDRISPRRFEVITPRGASSRGCQLSLLVPDRPEELLSALKAEGIICDFRKPNVIRVAPVPFYNTFHDVWAFAEVLAVKKVSGRIS